MRFLHKLSNLPLKLFNFLVLLFLGDRFLASHSHALRPQLHDFLLFLPQLFLYLGKLCLCAGSCRTRLGIFYVVGVLQSGDALLTKLIHLLLELADQSVFFVDLRGQFLHEFVLSCVHIA